MAVIGMIVLIFVVVGIVQVTVNSPQIQEKKKGRQSDEANYIERKDIAIAKQYTFEDEYYTNNINWDKGITCSYIVDTDHKNIHIFYGDTRRSIPFNEIIGCDIC